MWMTHVVDLAEIGHSDAPPGVVRAFPVLYWVAILVVIAAIFAGIDVGAALLRRTWPSIPRRLASVLVSLPWIGYLLVLPWLAEWVVPKLPWMTWTR